MLIESSSTVLEVGCYGFLVDQEVSDQLADTIAVGSTPLHCSTTTTHIYYG